MFDFFLIRMNTKDNKFWCEIWFSASFRPLRNTFCYYTSSLTGAEHPQRIENKIFLHTNSPIVRLWSLNTDSLGGSDATCEVWGLWSEPRHYTKNVLSFLKLARSENAYSTNCYTNAQSKPRHLQKTYFHFWNWLVLKTPTAPMDTRMRSQRSGPATVAENYATLSTRETTNAH